MNKNKLDKRVQRQLAWASQTDTLDIVVLYNCQSADVFNDLLGDLTKALGVDNILIRFLPRGNIAILAASQDVIHALTNMSSVVFISSVNIDIKIT